MNPNKFIIFTALLLCIVFTSSCPREGNTNESSSASIFVGSTPCDKTIQSMLKIPLRTKIDFIRWKLTLNNRKLNHPTFVLDIVFGISQPNTLEFKGGMETRTFEGKYVVSENNQGEIVHLKSDKLPGEISLVKLNENLLHLLTPQNRLMVGNGGWSYTLNRKNPIDQTGTLPYLSNRSITPGDSIQQVIFEGRTPCLDFSKDHNWSVEPGCFKLKWKLILNKDPQTLLPTTYQLRRVIDNQPKDTEGKWALVKGTSSHPNVLIYKLDPDMMEESISLLAGDDNVIFFLDRNLDLYVGNDDFSYTLNRRIK